MSKTICIDFDGVIHAYSKGWHNGKIYDLALPGSFDAIRALQDRGYAVVVMTARTDLVGVANWIRGQGFTDRLVAVDLRQHYGVPFWNDTKTLFITNRKLPALAYIDDRGIRFENNWDQILNQFQGDNNA